jgi:hypothetical protein
VTGLDLSKLRDGRETQVHFSGMLIRKSGDWFTNSLQGNLAGILLMTDKFAKFGDIIRNMAI